MKVYLLRHGETEWNALRKWQGSTDIELNDVGIKQAERAALSFENCKVKALYSSNLVRAKKTAEVINDIAFNGELVLHIEEDLAEIKLGHWEGLTYDEVSEKHSDDFKRWSLNHTEVIGYGVENFYDLQQRAFNIFNKICTENSDDILIVSHGAWIRALICKLLHIPLESKMHFEIENTSITTIEVIQNGAENNYIIKTLNDVKHVKE